MEHIEGISLQALLKQRPSRKLPEEHCKDIFVQMLKALDYLHERHVAHRDIKLENVLIEHSTNKVKLIDFGFACQSKDKLRVLCGTPSYMSPEIVSKKDYYGPQSDIWAVGILLYTLICGTFPFKSSFEKELYRKI